MKKIILVTGASSNLGAEVIRQLAKLGNIIYAGSRNLRNVSYEHTNIVLLKLDITSDADCRETVKKIIKDKGRIDVLINCAGYTPSGPAIDFTPKDYFDVLNTNTIGAFRLIRETYPYMKNNGSGRIINITSLNGLVSLPNYGIYSASKHALEALGLALRQELKSSNILVTNIASGAIKDESGKKRVSEYRSAREKFGILRMLMPFLSARKVAGEVAHAIERSDPPARVVIGMDAKIITFLVKILPFEWWNNLLYFVWSRK